ncbi:lipid-A-disaccharide synthase [bacterium]|nr:lipid-A-disaccharide synthase [bacterium]
MAKKIFIITGDYSADIHASGVAREIKKLMPDAIIEGVGEANLEEAGVKLFRNHEKMGKMGLTPKSVFEHLFLGLDIVKYLKNEFKPDLVLLVDYGAFNLQISKQLKKAGIKTFFFIPPQIWASRKYRLKTIKKNIDKVLTIFPFEKEFYEKEGIDSTFVGHPIVSELPECNNKEEFFKRHNLDINKKLVGIFPGSRIFEIKYLLKVFLAAIKLIEKIKPDVQFVFSHAKNLKDDAFNVPYKKIKGENHQLLAYSDALILASGTVALEAAMYETPMLIAYRGPIIFYLGYLLVRNIKKACLVNIITGKDYVDEFLQYDATPSNISSCICEMLDNPQKRNHILVGCKKTKDLLGQTHCVYEVAKIIKKELIGE